MIRFGRGLVTVTLLSLSALSLAALPPAEGTATVDAAWMKAFQANDLEAVLACYAPDAVAWLPDNPEAKGSAAIREAYRGFFAQNTVQSVSITDRHDQVSGNRAVAWGRFTMTLLPKGGDKPVTASGRFTEVTEKRGGRWVYVVDHASMDPAPAASK